MPSLELKEIDISKLTLNDEQESIRELIETSNKNIFVTGKAGTGKSTLLQALKNTTKKNFVVAAPTGVAALNVGGQTIHSLFKIPPKFIERHELKVSKQTKKLLSKIDMLVIDEISMVRVDLMDAIDEVLRQSKESDETFGGVQVVMFGDLYQLPPIVSDAELRKFFNETYGGHYFFNAEVWHEAELEKHELETIFRQEDEGFKYILNSIRTGDLNNEIFMALNKRVTKNPSRENLITLAMTNKIVNQINEQHLEELDTELFRYHAEIDGEFDKSSYPAEETIELKEGAQVMFLRNDPRKRWTNGTIGIVHALSEHEVAVDINGEVHTVANESWEKIAYYYNEDTKSIQEEELGSFTQLPLRLAWAITVHKSQGQTFDSAMIDLGWGAFAHGQTYVALSRCKSLDKLYLKRRISSRDIIVDPKVIEFMEAS